MVLVALSLRKGSVHTRRDVDGGGGGMSMGVEEEGKSVGRKNRNEHFWISVDY